MFYRAAKGVWVWEVSKEHDIFNIRAFTELVDDDRLVTNKKGFSCSVSKNRVYLGTPRYEKETAWAVETDPNGFRKGTNEYFIDKANFVFLGDSVPFGWGVDGDKNVPSKFYGLLRDERVAGYGVLNAAIPSYSLYQSVKRYEQEINGKFPVKYVILQIFDPTYQFIVWGADWDKRISWASKDTLVSSDDIVKKNLRKSNIFQAIIGRYSAIYHIIYCVKQRLDKGGDMPVRLDLDDKSAFETFEKENVSSLEELYSMVREDGAALVLISINPTYPKSFYTDAEFSKLPYRTRALRVVIERFNRMMREFAETHKGVYYFDVSSHFDSIGREGLFVDDSCHLSERGAEEQAEFIMDQLKKAGLI